jgi:SAM-dependent methyltransferase
MSPQRIFEDVYYDGEIVYYKKVDIQNHSFTITKDDKPISLEDWNSAVNRLYPMALKEKHKLFLIRLKEEMRRKSLARLVLQNNPKVVADVGTESGHITKYFLNKVEKVYCVDIDPEMVNQAVKNLSSSKVVGVVTGANKLELPDNSVDTLLAASVLEHLPDPASFIKEFKRVVRKNGRIIISVPNDLAIVKIKAILRKFGISRILGKLSCGLAMGHIQIFSLRDLRQIAQSGGKLIKSGYLLPHFLDIYAVVEVG